MTLVVSELVSNAVLHAGTNVELRLDVGPSSVRIEVYDQAEGVPQPRNPQPDEAGGRGLLIVGSIASVWGTETTPSGKFVWAELPR